MPTLAETIFVQVQLLGQRRNYLRTKREKATTANASGIQTQTTKSNHRKREWDPNPNNRKQPPQMLSGIQMQNSCKTPRWKNKNKNLNNIKNKTRQLPQQRRSQTQSLPSLLHP